MRRGVHNEDCRTTELNGQYSLLSDHFYYFGSKARTLPDDLMITIQKNQGHKSYQILPELVQKFEQWISQFEINRIYSDSQRSWFFNGNLTAIDLFSCSKICVKDEKKDEEDNVR